MAEEQATHSPAKDQSNRDKFTWGKTKWKLQKEKDPDGYAKKLAARQKKYWDKKRATMTPKERERINAANRVRNAKWRAKDVEKWRAGKRVRAKKIYDKDPEAARKKARESMNRQYVANPEKFKGKSHRRRGQIDSGSVTTEEWAEIKAKYGWRCAYCHKCNVELTMDHVVPLSKGGHHCPGNVVPACKPCNSRKGKKITPFPEPLPDPGPPCFEKCEIV